jgi:hypothetical protein
MKFFAPYVLPAALDRFQTYEGNPTGALTPTAVGYYCFDTTNYNMYVAITAINTGWRLFTRAA